MTKLVLTVMAAATACGAGTADPNGASLERADAVRSRAAFEAALARYDASTGPKRNALAAEVDALAAQKYATVSRLYWHTDLDAALAEARRLDRPVLSLRMLGRLDADYSCANSRFFRVALYANSEVSDFLRETFVLHWSSEREVPVITVDFGDGRVMKRTLAGNSAHYVLDPQGRPVDVLPGLYGPDAFVAALRESAAMAARVADLDRPDRDAAVRAYHAGRPPVASPIFATVASSGRPRILDAERIAVTKAAIEIPVLAEIDYVRRIEQTRSDDRLRGAVTSAPARLDARSRELVASLAPVDWGSSRPLEGEALDQLIAAFERQIGIDTALNENGLRPIIRGWFADGTALTADFAELNARIYRELFLTPRDDRWLGMAATGTFTALPRSGIARAP